MDDARRPSARPNGFFARLPARLRPAWLLVGLPLLLLTGGGAWGLSGCTPGSGTAPDVAAGRFVATVDGALTDTLTGTARFRTDGSALTGVELNVDSLHGLSMEMEPVRLDRRTYEVVDWRLLGVDRGASPPGLAAFLEVRPGSFHATDGVVEVTYVASDRVGARFDLEMVGTFHGVPGDEPSVRVTGRLFATNE